ncbi:MAG: hypothetical protein OJJ21_08405 [Ferrovibrio sp.]|uniref:hypothetical protein n=1 Tax=Ferrovibrio sp. TaxID=1917215 RepID=UPI002608FFD1|nr:hypothetical protein [Ferrovibrio sp.]MCW0233604.1 hypothetical protein [Ferrovibrio sp.]
MTTAAGRVALRAAAFSAFWTVFFAVFALAAGVLLAALAALVTDVVTVLLFFCFAAAGFLAAAGVLDLDATLGLLPAVAVARLRVVVFAMADPPLQTPVFGRSGPGAEAPTESGSV